jgi:hypothetical protein
MGMGTRQQPRKPAGTPVGGQFAPTAHDEADISLLSPKGQAQLDTEQIEPLEQIERGVWEVTNTTTEEEQPANGALRRLSVYLASRAGRRPCSSRTGRGP